MSSGMTKLAAVERRPHLRGAHQLECRARARAEAQVGVGAGGLGERDRVVLDRGATCTARAHATSSDTSVGGDDAARAASSGFDGVALTEHERLGPRVGVAHRDAHHEAVALRFGKGVGALHLERVLRRDDEERLGQRMRARRRR